MGDCDAGYYCPGTSDIDKGGVTNPRPSDIAIYFGDRCPSGEWCGIGQQAGT